jgi:Dolichyl-phosphate-mannose-protein mannosyltransferase
MDARELRRAALWLSPMVLCALAGWVFMSDLDAESLWYDEYFTWNFSTQPFSVFWEEMSRDVHPPLYYLLMRAWVAFSGSQTLFVMRLSSALIALLAVALCFRITWDWFKDRWTALTAAGFLLSSGLFIYFARELRMYALVVLLVLLSWWLLERLIRERGSIWPYALALAVMAYTYYFTAFFGVMQIVYVLECHRPRLGRVLRAYALAALLIAPLLPLFYGQLAGETRLAGRGEMSLANFGKTSAVSATNWTSISTFITRYTAGQGAFVLLAILLAVLSVRAIHRPVYRQRVILLVLWLMTAALFFAVNLRVPVYNLRYMLMIIPALALLVGLGMKVLPAYARPSAAVFVVVAGLLSHTDAFLPPKIPHHDLLTTIKSHYQPGDKIWYLPPAGALGSDLSNEVHYYTTVVVPELESDFFVWSAPDDLVGARRIWDARPYWIDVPEAARAGLNAGRTVTERYDFGAYSLRLYEAPPQTVTRFGATFGLQAAPLDSEAFQPGEVLRLKLWWQALKPIDRDYSLGLYVLDAAGTVRAQTDAALLVGSQPTSQWPVGGGGRYSPATLALPATLPAGMYSLWAGVYYWETPTRLTVESSLSVNAERDLVQVGAIVVGGG